MKKMDISRLNKNRGIYLKLGLIVALGFSILAFNYTVYDFEKPIDWETTTTVEPTIEVVRTKHESKPLPPPPKFDIAAEILIEDTPEFVEEPLPEVITDAAIIPNNEQVSEVLPKATRPKPKPKPIVIPEEIEEEEPLYTIVENMPEFGDCGASKNKDERRQLSQKNLLQFIYKHIKYPRIALENGIAGRVFVRFIVNKDGFIENAEIIKEPGGGLGKEVLRIIDLMPQWKPGKQGMHHVNVQYTLPVDFKPM